MNTTNATTNAAIDLSEKITYVKLESSHYNEVGNLEQTYRIDAGNMILDTIRLQDFKDLVDRQGRDNSMQYTYHNGYDITLIWL